MKVPIIGQTEEKACPFLGCALIPVGQTAQGVSVQPQYFKCIKQGCRFWHEDAQACRFDTLLQQMAIMSTEKRLQHEETPETK